MKTFQHPNQSPCMTFIYKQDFCSHIRDTTIHTVNAALGEPYNQLQIVTSLNTPAALFLIFIRFNILKAYIVSKAVDISWWSGYPRCYVTWCPVALHLTSPTTACLVTNANTNWLLYHVSVLSLIRLPQYFSAKDLFIHQGNVLLNNSESQKKPNLINAFALLEVSWLSGVHAGGDQDESCASSGRLLWTCVMWSSWQAGAGSHWESWSG